MKKTIRWIVLIWSVLAIPYAFTEVDFETGFFSLLYAALIIWLMVSDLKEEK